MDSFFKIAAGTMLALILIIAVGRQEKGISVLLSMLVCCMIALSALHHIQPIMDFMIKIEASSGLQSLGLSRLLKITGIGFVAEIASAVCQDAGNASLGKELQILACVVMINLSLPLLETMLELIQMILGGI